MTQTQVTAKVFLSLLWTQLIRGLGQRRLWWQRQRQKTIVFVRKATALHVHHAFFKKTESLDNAILDLWLA